MKKLLAILLCACVLLSMVACGDGTDPTDPSETTGTEASSENTGTEAPSETTGTEAPSETTGTEPPATDAPATEPPATEPPATDPPATEPPATEAPKPYTNLIADFDAGVDTTDKHKTWGWDAENKYITASESLECTWGTSGYGKIFLVDGVKSESKELLFTEGAWLSCVIEPGWGDYSGNLDSSTVEWKKNDVDEWLIFDLQTTCIVDKFNFSTLYRSGQHGMPTDFTIQVSSDKTNWKTVVTMTGYEQDITSDDQSFTFSAEECRYVKLHVTKTAAKIDANLAYCVGLSEVEIWGRQK